MNLFVLLSSQQEIKLNISLYPWLNLIISNVAETKKICFCDCNLMEHYIKCIVFLKIHSKLSNLLL